MNVLVINCGSSSVKFEVVDTSKKKCLVKGHVDGVGLDSCVFRFGDESEKVFLKNHDEALNLVLKKLDLSTIQGIGHRFVHGGSHYNKPVLLTSKVISDLEKLNELAPLHNPHNLAGIRACAGKTGVPQVAVFDTAFYSELPEKVYTYALHKDLIKKHKLRKYGFHGISHNYLVEQTKELLAREKINLISCHLGNGSSVSCIKNNKCVETSMGFTPLEGLVMGTRSGDVDPGLVLFLQNKLKLSNSDVNDLLNKKSGLKGLTGKSDMRSVYEDVLNNDNDASLALDIFCHRLVKYIGSYLAAMQDETHALVFSAGIGEGAFYVRKKVCDSLKHLGVVIDYDKNMADKGLIKKPKIISSSDSKIKVLVIPTYEELMIALETESLLSK